MERALERLVRVEYPVIIAKTDDDGTAGTQTPSNGDQRHQRASFILEPSDGIAETDCRVVKSGAGKERFPEQIRDRETRPGPSFSTLESRDIDHFAAPIGPDHAVSACG
jgi:hypothetical protein